MSAAGASSGLLALRNATQKSVAFSSSLSETRPRVLSLLADCLRSVPWIKRAYGIRMTESVRARAQARNSPRPVCVPITHRPPHIPPALLVLYLFTRRESPLPPPRLVYFQKMRSLITAAFKEKKATADVHKVNRLIVMGRMELEETMMLWKGPSHVSNYFENAAEAQKKAAKAPAGFLDKFYSGAA